MFCFRKLLKAVLLSLIISVVLVGLFSVIVYFADISDRAVSGVIFVFSAISVFMGALVLAKNVDRGGLVNGLLTAVGYLVVLTVISLAVNGSINLNLHNILRFAACSAAGMLGGVIGINSTAAK